MYDPNTAPPPPAASPSGQRRQWGALSVTLIVIGLLILIPSGLCTGIFGIGALYDMFTSSSSEGMSILMEALVIGGIPLAIGGILVYAAFQARK
jgi:predicted lipid-binding transport protein (Tim44 family)